MLRLSESDCEKGVKGGCRRGLLRPAIPASSRRRPHGRSLCVAALRPAFSHISVAGPSTRPIAVRMEESWARGVDTHTRLPALPGLPVESYWQVPKKNGCRTLHLSATMLRTRRPRAAVCGQPVSPVGPHSFNPATEFLCCSLLAACAPSHPECIGVHWIIPGRRHKNFKSLESSVTLPAENGH